MPESARSKHPKVPNSALITLRVYDRITTTIERERVAENIAGTKKIEYRQIKPCERNAPGTISVPFELCLLNGMNPPVPEVTVLIHKITKDRLVGEYQLQEKLPPFTIPNVQLAQRGYCKIGHAQALPFCDERTMLWVAARTLPQLYPC